MILNISRIFLLLFSKNRKLQIEISEILKYLQHPRNFRQNQGSVVIFWWFRCCFSACLLWMFKAALALAELAGSVTVWKLRSQNKNMNNLKPLKFGKRRGSFFKMKMLSIREPHSMFKLPERMEVQQMISWTKLPSEFLDNNMDKTSWWNIEEFRIWRWWKFSTNHSN